jgi:chemotaxis protein CheY-P-specific phosphatase CheC
MKADIRSLGTFNRLAEEGAERAASALSELTGLDLIVEVAGINFSTIDDLSEEFQNKQFSGVQIGVEGGMSGDTVLAFDRSGVEMLLENIMPGDWREQSSEMQKSGVKEAGNIMLGGFVNGWADHFGEKIKITPPRYVEGEGDEIFPEDTPEWTDSGTAFTFSSQLKTLDGVVDFHIYMFPERKQFARLLAQETDEQSPVPLDKLTVFNLMTKYGSKQAATKLTSMSGIETGVEVSRLRFVPIQDVAQQIEDRPYVAVVVEFEGLPSGYTLLFFSEESAMRVADELVPVETGDGFGDMQESAIQEIGNIMTSGFVDGWANVLETTTKLSSPEVIHDDGPAILGSVAVRLSRHQEYAFVHDSRIHTPEREVDCSIFALPDQEELRQALDSISLEEAAQNEQLPESELKMTKTYDDLK